MHFSRLSHLFLAVGMFAADGLGGALAHTIIGSLGQKAKATDVFQISCFDDGQGEPARLIANVLDAAPVQPPLVSLQISRAGTASSTTDAVDGDNVPSPRIRNTGGAAGATGVFDVFIDKTGAGIENYQVEVHCVNAGGLHTGLSGDDAPLQNQ